MSKSKNKGKRAFRIQNSLVCKRSNSTFCRKAQVAAPPLSDTGASQKGPEDDCYNVMEIKSAKGGDELQAITSYKATWDDAISSSEFRRQ